MNTEITDPSGHSIDSTFLNYITCNIKLAIEGLYNSGADRLVEKDSVTAYLRNTNSPFQILDSAKAIIDSVSFTGNFNFNHTSSGTYYIMIKHKNSLETWSKAGGENLAGGINNFDFTTSSSQAYGNNLTLKGSKYCIYSGNVNGDDIIDAEDMAIVDNDVFNYTFENIITNLNGDSIVDIEDMAIVDRNGKNLIVVQSPLTLFSKKYSLSNSFFKGEIR
jgi:hypothetical protein